MSSTAGQYFQNSQYSQQFPNFPPYAQNYIPMVNVPTLNKMPTHGEVVASIELLTATMKQFSARLDRIESRVNDWANLEVAERMNINEKNIDILKKQIIENDDKIISTNKDVDYAYVSIRDTNERVREDEKIIDRLTDMVSDHKSRIRHLKKNSSSMSKKYAEIGILRRRVSKVEDFNTEFVECFETPLHLKGIIMDMSSQMEECDRAVTMIVKYGCGKCEEYNACCNHSKICEYYKEMEATSCDDIQGIEDWKTVEEYFKNYDDDNNDENITEDKERENIERCDDVDIEEEDDFEKL
jgi:polyhydroxyalkanoate synthesis regulator phasin